MAGNPMMLCGILMLMAVGDCALGAPTILHNDRLSLDGWTDTESPFVRCEEDQECGHLFKCSATSWYEVDGDFPRICVPKTQSDESSPPAFVTNLLSPGEPGRYNLYYCYYDKECPTGGVCKWVEKLASGICLYPDSKLDFTDFSEPPEHRSAPSENVQYCSTNDECDSDHFCLNEEWMTNLGYLDYGVCMPKGYKYGPDNFHMQYQSEPIEVQHRQADEYQRQALSVGNSLPQLGDPNSIIYCHSDGECPSGQYCLFGAWEGLFGKFDYGVCMAKRQLSQTPCTMSSQCPESEYCSYEGVCKSMYDNQQMASGQVAAQAQAQPVPQARAQPRVHYCKSSAECTFGEYCLMRPESWKNFGSYDYGVCMPREAGHQAIPQSPVQNPSAPVNVARTRCSSFSECRTGEYCSPDGRCLPMFINQPLGAANMDPGVMGTDPSQGPSKVIYCKGNSDCPVGGKCVMGEWTQFGRFDYGVCMPKNWRPSLTGSSGGNLLLLPQSSDPRSQTNQAEGIKYCSQDSQCGFGEVCLHGAWTEMGYYDYGVCMPMDTGLRSSADDPRGHFRQASDPGTGNTICTVCKDDSDCHSQEYCTAYLGSDDGLCWPRVGGPTPPKVPGSTICKQMTADSAKRCAGDRDCPAGQYCNTFLLSLNHQEGVCIPTGDAPAVVPPAQYQPVPQDDSTLCNLCKTDAVCGSGFYCTAYMGTDDGVCWPRQGFGLLNVIPGKTVCNNGAPDLAGILLPAQAQPVATLSTPLGKVRCKLCSSDSECDSSEYCTAYKGTDQGLCWPDQGPMVPENLVPGVDLCSGTPDFKMCTSVADCNKETEYCTAYKGDDTGVCYPRLASIPSSGSSSGGSAPSGSALEAQAQPVAVIGEASSLTSVTGSAFACKLCSGDDECDSSEYCTAYKGSDKGLCWPKAGVPGPPNPIPGQSFCNYFAGGGDGDGGGSKPTTDITLCKDDKDCKVKEYCTAYLGTDKGVCWPVAVAAAQVPVAEIQFQPVPKPESQSQGGDSKPASSTLCKLCKKQDECAIDEYCTAYLGSDEGICWPKINAPAFFPGISICPVKTTTPQLCKTDSECTGDGKYCTAFMGTDWGVCFPKEGGAMYKQDQPVEFKFEALVIDPEALAKSHTKEVGSPETESDEDSVDYFDADKFLQKLIV